MRMPTRIDQEVRSRVPLGGDLLRYSGKRARCVVWLLLSTLRAAATAEQNNCLQIRYRLLFQSNSKRKWDLLGSDKHMLPFGSARSL